MNSSLWLERNELIIIIKVINSVLLLGQLGVGFGEEVDFGCVLLPDSHRGFV